MGRRLTGQQCALVLAHRNIPHAAVGHVSKRRIGDSSPLYNDLVSAAYEGLCDAARRYDPARGTKFSTWAHRICSGYVVDEWRRIGDTTRRGRLRPLPVYGSVLEQAAGGADDPALDDSEDGPAIQALAGLPDRERLVMTLCVLEDMQRQDVADLLGVHPTRVSQLFTSGARRMRAELAA